ncbi:MAG: YybH family protein [Gemmatimonadota bacterium]
MTGCRIVRVEPSETPEEAPDLRSQISQMLASSAAAWNRGDLEAFLSDYERAPSTTYIGRDGLRLGFEAIRERYAPLFAPRAERDSLRFESLRVRPIGPMYALVTARYVLHSGGAVTSSGPFTLLLNRIEGHWKIVHDHSSSDPTPAPEP